MLVRSTALARQLVWAAPSYCKETGRVPERLCTHTCPCRSTRVIPSLCAMLWKLGWGFFLSKEADSLSWLSILHR